MVKRDLQNRFCGLEAFSRVCVTTEFDFVLLWKELHSSPEKIESKSKVVSFPEINI